MQSIGNNIKEFVQKVRKTSSSSTSYFFEQAKKKLVLNKTLEQKIKYIPKRMIEGKQKWILVIDFNKGFIAKENSLDETYTNSNKTKFKKLLE